MRKPVPYEVMPLAPFSDVDIWNIALLYLATSLSSVVGEASAILVTVTKEKARVGTIKRNALSMAVPLFVFCIVVWRSGEGEGQVVGGNPPLKKTL